LPVGMENFYAVNYVCGVLHFSNLGGNRTDLAA